MRLTGILFLLFPLLTFAQETRLLRQPDIHQDKIVFTYGGDLWVRSGTEAGARRLTSFPGVETAPHFSPDGTMIAFASQYDGNYDVYVVPTEGGVPKRLTWHPGSDEPVAWTNDGNSIIFSSGRTRAPLMIPDQLWSVSADGNFPERFILPRAVDGSFSPDGDRMAFEMILRWESEFRNYRGGQNNPIRIFDLESHETTDLPWEDSDDRNPVWVGDDIYYLSDRDNLKNIWKYNVSSGALEQVTRYKEFDIKSLASDGEQLVFDMGGYLYVMTPGSEPVRQSIQVLGDFPWMRPHWENAGNSISNVAISPNAKRIVVESHGEIITVPAEKGSPRNLTSQPGSAQRSPAWSPDGKWISYFSDESGEYQLKITDQYGTLNKTIDIPGATFFYTPAWSPDSKHISFGDADRNLWVVTVATGSVKKIDNEGFAHPMRIIYPEWSPDSKYVAYTRRLESEYAAIFVYSISSGETIQITDGLANSMNPAWDKSGKYLYFMSSTDYGLNVGWLDMTSYAPDVNSGIYMAVLDPEEPSPLLSESDEESIEEEAEEDAGSKEKKGKKEEESEDESAVNVSFEEIGKRIVALPVPVSNYITLEAGPEGSVYFTESMDGQGGLTLKKFLLKDREPKEVTTGVQGFEFTPDGSKMLYNKGGQFAIAPADGPVNPSDQAISTSDIKVYVDPALEYQQIFREAVRYQRDYFYVENVHGLDLDWITEHYGSWVEHVRHRDDLNFLLDVLGGETSVGHSFVGGGDYPDVESVPVGLLGVDVDNTGDGYRITKIFTGESWNPSVSAPLSGPGIDAAVGDYIVSVNGRPVSADRNFYSFFPQTAGKVIRVGISSSASGANARIFDVKPVSNEGQLRQYEWIESNRRLVDEMSDGKLAYVWLPNTAFAGYTNFNRYYFAQKDKQGAIIDERFNQGGSAADYIVDLLDRELMGYFNNPVGDKQPFTSPAAALFGPKVMIVNEMAGSGGDYLPYMFRKSNVGPLVGTKTWGGLVGIWDVPPLMDGGGITAPRGGFFNVDGQWAVENEGVEPDYNVVQTPSEVIDGKDPQLLKAIEVALELLRTEGVELIEQPADPVRAIRPGNE